MLRSKISEEEERHGEVCFIIHILWYRARAGDCIVFAVKFPAAVEHRLADVVVQTVLSSGPISVLLLSAERFYKLSTRAWNEGPSEGS